MFRRSALRFLGFFALILWPVTADAASRKGIAAPLLPSWTAAEIKLLADTVIANKSVTNFEFAFWATYLNDGTYGNAQDLIGRLLKGGKQVTVRVFLGQIHDATPSSQLWQQGINLNVALIVPYKNNSNVTFKVSPSLEDEFPDQATWESAAKAVLKRLDTGVYTRLSMIRCTTTLRSDNKTPRTGGRITVPTTINSGSGAVSAQAECHSTTRAGSAAYSNDGQFVYIGSEKFNNSTTKHAGVKTLTDFRSDGTRWAGAQMLWRPSYNLHPSDGAKTNRVFDGQYSRGIRIANKYPAFDSL